MYCMPVSSTIFFISPLYLELKDLPVLKGPQFSVIVSICYVVLVLVILPKLMKKRNPFQLKQVILSYNVLQIIFNVYLFAKVNCHFLFD